MVFMYKQCENTQLQLFTRPNHVLLPHYTKHPSYVQHRERLGLGIRIMVKKRHIDEHPALTGADL